MSSASELGELGDGSRVEAFLIPVKGRASNTSADKLEPPDALPATPVEGLKTKLIGLAEDCVPSKLKEIKDGVQYSGLRKNIGYALLFLGAIPKAVLNMPLLKQLCYVSSMFGLVGGVVAGGALGLLVLKPMTGAVYGGQFGMKLLDPRTIFNGLCSAGDKMVRNNQGSETVRKLVYNFTNLTTDPTKFVFSEFQYLFSEVFKSRGERFSDKAGEFLNQVINGSEVSREFTEFLREKKSDMGKINEFILENIGDSGDPKVVELCFKMKKYLKTIDDPLPPLIPPKPTFLPNIQPE